MSDSKPPAAKSVREPSALSSEYHKAHKQLMLWATILFIWELVGVDLSKAKDAGGNVGPIVTALKSPQAVPWVLLILVLYFLFKCSVEWAQCHPDRQKVRFARIDYTAAWIVALAAIALYLGQTISRVQFANVLTTKNLISAQLGFMMSMGLFGAAFGLYDWFQIRSRHGLAMAVFFLFMGLVGVLGFLIPEVIISGRSWRSALVGAAITTMAVLVPILGRRFSSSKFWDRFQPIHLSKSRLPKK